MLSRPCWCCLIGLAAAAPSLGAGPDPRLDRFEYVETHMGSAFRLVLYSTDEPTARRASRAAFDRIAALNAIMSDYDPESELSRLCRKAGGPPVAVSPELFDILLRSKTMHDRSAGAFDVTVAPLVRLWRRARRDHKMPATDRLAEAKALVGSDSMVLDPKARTVQLRKPGMKLDLGAIAKGYASQEAIGVLKREGVPRALVAGAGDIVVGDPPPGRAAWIIGVAPLETPEGRPRRYLRLTNRAVSTSGDTEQYVVIDGKRYSHIVDPKTGLGVVSRSSVTVVAPDGATADSLDTAVYLLGPERGLKLIEETPGAAALIVRKTETGEEVIASRRFHEFETEPPKSPADSSLTRP